MVRLPAGLAVLAVAVGLLLGACGSSRAGGAGSLTVTSRAAAAPATTFSASRTSRTSRTSRRRRRRATPATAAAPVRFAQTRLRGTDHTLTVPRGWHAAVFAHVSGARIEAWSPQGTLLVSSPGTGTVTEITPHPHRTATQRTILSGLTLPQGLAFSRLGGREYLYVAASNALYCYVWRTPGIPGHRTTTVADLPDTLPAGDDVHRMKDVVAAPNGTLYLDIGSSSNATVPPPLRAAPSPGPR